MVLSIREIGRLWFHGPYVLQVFVGLCISASLISPVYFWQVQYVRYILFIIFVVGSILFIKDLPVNVRKFSRAGQKMHVLRKLRTYLLIYSLTFLFFSNLHSRYFVFENHDVLYFGWMQEAWDPGYPGPVRVPTEYPSLMSSNHLMPGALLSTLGALLPSMNLVKAIDLRYFIICLVLGSLALEIYKKNRRRFLQIMLIGSALSLLYGSEISTELNMSSFVYVLLLAVIMYVLFDSQSSEQREHFIVLFSLLLIAKAPILLIPTTVLFYMVANNTSRFLSTKNLFVFSLAIFNVWSWASTPKPKGLGTGFPKPVGFLESGGKLFDFKSIRFDEILGWYTGHEAWFIFRYIQKPYIFGIVVFLILFKIYFVYFYFRKKIGLSSTSISILDMYMLASLVSWLFLRNNGTIAHQAHAYLLASTVTFVVAVSFFSQKLKLRYVVPVFIVSVLIQIPTKYFPFFENDMDVRLTGKATMTLIEAEGEKVSSNDPIGKQQVYFSMHGQRLPVSNSADYSTSQVHLFTQFGR